MLRSVRVKVYSTIALGLLLAFSVVALTAGGASPLATQNARIGPYQLLLSFYSLPRAGQELNVTIESSIPGMSVQFTQAVLNPAKGTDGSTLAVTVTPDNEAHGVYDVYVTPPVQGRWLLHLQVTGSSGNVSGDIPINVDGPPAIPIWLGWLIGLLPLPLLIAFIWFQFGWRKTQRERLRKEMRQQV